MSLPTPTSSCQPSSRLPYYLWPLVVTNTRDMRTLPIGIQSLRDILEFPEWQLIMAGATIVVLPLVLLFLLTQKQFIEGAIQGALKG